MFPTNSYLISQPYLTQVAAPVTVAKESGLAVVPTIAYENPINVNTLYQPLYPPVYGYDVNQVLKYQQIMENEKLIDERIKEKVNSQIEKFKTHHFMEKQLENKINECKHQKSCCQNDSIVSCKCNATNYSYQNECKNNRDTYCCSSDSCGWDNQRINTKLCCSSYQSINDSCCSSNQRNNAKLCCSGNQSINDSCCWDNQKSNVKSCCSGNQSNSIQKCCCTHETKRQDSSTCMCGNVCERLDDKIERIRKELKISTDHKRENSCVHFNDHREIVTPDKPKIVYPSNTKYEVTHERPSRSRSRSKSANSRKSSRSLSPGSRPLWKPTGANDYTWANETRSKMINEQYPVRPKSASTNESKKIEIPIKYIDTSQRPQSTAVYDHYYEYHLNRDRELKSHSKVQMHKMDSNGNLISQSYTDLRSLSPPVVERRVTWKPTTINYDNNDYAWSTHACKSTTNKPLTSTTTVYTTTKNCGNYKSNSTKTNIPVTVVKKTIRQETRTRSQSPPNNYYYHTNSHLINSQVPKTSVEKKIAVNTNNFYNKNNNLYLKNYNTSQSIAPSIYYRVPSGATTNTNKDSFKLY